MNSVEYGLSAAVYTRDINAALHAVHAIDTGITYVNAPTIGAEIPLPVRRHQAHRQRLPRGRRPRHRAVQPGEDGVRRLLGHAPTGADRQPGGRVMSAAPATTPTLTDDVARPLRRRGRPGAAGLLRRRRRARRGLVRVGRRRSSLPRPRVGHRRHQHRPPAPARRGGDPRPGRRAAPHVGRAQAPALHPGLRGDRRAGPVPARPQGVPLQQRRRGGRRRHQAGPPHHRQARDHRLPAGVPRPHDGRHQPHHRQGRLPGGLRPAAARRCTSRPTASARPDRRSTSSTGSSAPRHRPRRWPR